MQAYTTQYIGRVHCGIQGIFACEHRSDHTGGVCLCLQRMSVSTGRVFLCLQGGLICVYRRVAQVTNPQHRLPDWLLLAFPDFVCKAASKCCCIAQVPVPQHWYVTVYSPSGL